MTAYYILHLKQVQCFALLRGTFQYGIGMYEYTIAAPSSVFGHSRGGSGMECRTWIILLFSFSWAASLYPLWIGSPMVLTDVVFES
jgi:uncharacterized protein (DUF486 family)